jgi:hypothetical protein
MRTVDRPAVPAWTRWFVAAFLTAFVLCGAAGIEAWPLTGWRLFADARKPVQVAWEAVTVDAAGRETAVPFRDLPVGFHGNVQVLKGFAGLGAGEQAAVCRAWADAVRARGGQVEAVRIYRTVADVSRRVGERGAPPARELRWACAGKDGGVAPA